MPIKSTEHLRNFRKMILNLSGRLFHLFLLIIGISIGIVSTLCLKSFSFSIPSLTFSVPISISNPLQPPPPPPQPENPPPPPPPLASNGTSNNTIIYDVSNNLENNRTIFGLMHNMSDDELLLRASRVDQELPRNIKIVEQYKVAFMFLTPGPLPLAPFWDRFFTGHQGMYSIYVHPHPSFNYSSVPQDSAFYGRAIPSQTSLANALLDPSNQRFVLLSDSCIPVFNFTTIYNYLMGTNHSFLGSFDDPRKPGRGRYNRLMWPNVTIEQWRKGSQWFEIHRELAVKIVSDDKYYKIFRDFCLPPCYNDLTLFANVSEYCLSGDELK
ncbi:hypothetical protein DH2020_015914 [Rehmannia glutinosa]|uniref:Uncharacterized protein n=1 Tax=Rehmannia glutinosa TaxID=99300 RepID=A0ABR0WU52_REHGL